MNTPENPKQISVIDEGPLILGEFMSALQRLFRIGVYYPSGHAIFDQAIDRFLSILISLSGKKHFVRIEDNGKSLLLEQVRLEDSQVFVGEFRRLMTVLSITAIEINRDISRDDMAGFIRRLISSRSKGSNIKKFSSIEIEDLPPTIHVTQKEYLAKESMSADGRLESAAKNLNVFYEALVGYGLSGEQIEQCRLVLSSLPAHIKKLTFKHDDLPSVSWDDIAMLLAHAVQGKPLVNRGTFHGNLDILASILGNLEQETEDKKSRDAINFLVSILKKTDLIQDDEEESQQTSEGRNSQLLSVVEMQDFIDKNRLNPLSLQNVQNIPTESETLSVLLQLAQQQQSLQNQSRMLQLFHDVLGSPPNEKIWDILAQGLLAIVKSEDRTHLAMIVRMLTEALHRSEHADPLELFLRVLKLCDGREENSLWPFAVNELLISGGKAGSDTFRLLCTRLSRLSWKDMIQELRVLKSLEAFQKGQVAACVFPELSSPCYPLCAFLLKTQIGPRIIGHVISALRKSPADKMIKAVAPLLDPSLPEHKEFLDRYLRYSQQRGAAEGLKVLAGGIITEGLSALPQEQREQPWVAETISAIAEFQGSGGRELLNQIVMKKRLLLLSEWPSSCRKAAEEALAKMSRRSKMPRKSL